MARHSSFTNMFRFVIALLTAMLVTVIGGLAVPAMAHDGSGSNSGSTSGSNSGPGPNSGPGNADCHDNSGPGPNSGPGSTSGSGGGSNSGSNSGPGPNSGPGNADGDCPVDGGGDPGGDSGGDSSIDPGTRPSASNSGGSVATAPQAQPSAKTVQAGAEVPTAVNAGLSSSDGEQSPALAVLAILFGLAMTSVAMVRHRVRD